MSNTNKVEDFLYKAVVITPEQQYIILTEWNSRIENPPAISDLLEKIYHSLRQTLAMMLCAKLYKKRWEIELFFKWIKGNLEIKHYYGTSANAVKTQIWIAVSL